MGPLVEALLIPLVAITLIVASEVQARKQRIVLPPGRSFAPIHLPHARRVTRSRYMAHPEVP